mmetsp:Transcript_641/g.2275  ORF Transcript_641/g.2275 Transcript_641/m.2275 type:complete len:317 (+) Transcript_641:196-1146(+)
MCMRAARCRCRGGADAVDRGRGARAEWRLLSHAHSLRCRRRVVEKGLGGLLQACRRHIVAPAFAVLARPVHGREDDARGEGVVEEEAVVQQNVVQQNPHDAGDVARRRQRHLINSRAGGAVAVAEEGIQKLGVVVGQPARPSEDGDAVGDAHLEVVDGGRLAALDGRRLGMPFSVGLCAEDVHGRARGDAAVQRRAEDGRRRERGGVRGDELEIEDGGGDEDQSARRDDFPPVVGHVAEQRAHPKSQVKGAARVDVPVQRLEHLRLAGDDIGAGEDAARKLDDVGRGEVSTFLDFRRQPKRGESGALEVQGAGADS